MKKAFYYVAGILSIITGICCLYMLLTGHYTATTVAAGFECCIFGVVAVMIEPRPTRTVYQIQEDKRIKSQGVYIILMIAVAAVIVMFASI